MNNKELVKRVFHFEKPDHVPMSCMHLKTYIFPIKSYYDISMIEKMFKKRIKEIHDKYKDKNVLIFDDKSNFFGQESLGLGKIRGNGVLLLTSEDLYFGMWKPKKELTIPVKSIMEITNPKSHMHRSIFKPLLRVEFKNEKDESDSVAWFVQQLDRWNKILNEIT